MILALTEWMNRISPVFDVSGTVRIIAADGSVQIVSMPTDNPQHKLDLLKTHQVDVLICGAISRRIQDDAEALHIRVFPFISGNIDEVRAAWNNGTLDQPCYSMPGCNRCHRRRRTHNETKNQKGTKPCHKETEWGH